MKLATYKDGSRDGQLLVVSRDLASAHYATGIANTLQQVLDDWNFLSPQLQDLSDALNQGRARHAFPFEAARCMAPLPRAYQWVDGSAFANHVELLSRARGAGLPATFHTDPLMYQGGSDDLRPARAPIVLADESWGCDFEAEICVVTDDVPQGASRDEALAAIRLVGLVNDISLRNLIPEELAKGFGFVQSKPASHFSPVFVTPDALGDAWAGGKMHLPLLVDLNGVPFGRAEAGEECTFDFGELIVHLAKTRRIGAGSIIGSGTVSNRDPDGSPGRPVAEGGRGYSCIAEQRVVEQLLHGAARTPFLRHGDTVRIEMRDRVGHSIFGAIDHAVVPF